MIVVCTRSGQTARMVSRFRPPVFILGMTTDVRVWHKLAPVSYTHLDVYKRQLPYSPPSLPLRLLPVYVAPLPIFSDP